MKQDFSPIDAKIAILGLSFKENCPDLRNTKVITIIDRLKDYNCNITVSDPWVIPKAKDVYGISLKSINISKQHAIIIAVTKAIFELDMSIWQRMLEPDGVLIDVKSILNKEYFSDFNLRYWAL